MVVYLRLYKRFDLDLLSISSNGVSFSRYLPEILQAYAEGREYHLYIPFSKNFNIKKEQAVYMAKVTITEPESIQLLQRIKPYYRNSFCKALIRESLVHQHLGAYFADKQLANQERLRIAATDLESISGEVVIAKVKDKTENIQPNKIGQKSELSPTAKKDGTYQLVQKEDSNVSLADVPKSAENNLSDTQEKRKNSPVVIEKEGKTPSVSAETVVDLGRTHDDSSDLLDMFNSMIEQQYD